METINDRIKGLLEALGFTSLNAFDKALGVPRNTTVCYVGEKPSKPGADFLKKLFLTFEDIDARWVLTGEGEMFLPDERRKNFIETLQRNFETRDRDARRLETALDLASKKNINFRLVSKYTPVGKIRKNFAKSIARSAQFC